MYLQDHMISCDPCSSLWAVHGLNGEKVDNYPFHLQVTVEAPVLLLGLPTSEHDYILHTVRVGVADCISSFSPMFSIASGNSGHDWGSKCH